MVTRARAAHRSAAKDASNTGVKVLFEQDGRSLSEDNGVNLSSFAELALAPELCQALVGLGYEEPTPIQRAAIPPLLAGRDLVGQAATGTGKTAVIAEIAAQIASKGGRVLVASQANLAVDNALERIADVEEIFAVRLGRPESVKASASSELST